MDLRVFGSEAQRLLVTHFRLRQLSRRHQQVGVAVMGIYVVGPEYPEAHYNFAFGLQQYSEVILSFRVGSS